MNKIKVFLGAYVNQINAQNLNCRSILENLSSKNFEVYSLRTHFGDQKYPAEKTFYCFRPFRVSRHIGFLLGILNCDVAYLPKHIDTPLWVLKIAKIFQKKIFTTIEGNVTDRSKSNLIDLFGSQKKMLYYFSHFNAIYGISDYLIENANNILNIRDKPLFLGVNFCNSLNKNIKSLNTIIFIGSLIKRKRVFEFLSLAMLFPKINFRIVGDGPELNKLKNKSPINVDFTGELSNNDMYDTLMDADLLFLPSKSEGFPKVILEAASVGIPSIVYNTYGASSWIKHNHNGFIVSDFNEVECIINNLLDDSALLIDSSNAAFRLARKFDWKCLITNWEEEIKKIYNE